MGGFVSDIVDTVAGAINDIPVVGDIADDVLGIDPNGGGILPVVKQAVPLAGLYLTGGLEGLLSGGTSSAAAADAAFLSADAAQLAAQGLGEAQIASTLAASGASAGAANLAAAMAANGLSESMIAQQLGNLSANTGLMTQASDAAAMQDFYAADAAQLAAQTGNNVLAIEQNLIAAGLDPLDAATLAQNSVMALTPTTSMWSEFQDYLKRNPDVLNALGKAALAGAAVSQVPNAQANVTPIPAYKPADTMPAYDPAYYQQVQQYYNTYLPSTPRDVATPLQDWYSSGYTQPDSVTAKLFGV